MSVPIDQESDGVAGFTLTVPPPQVEPEVRTLFGFPIVTTDTVAPLTYSVDGSWRAWMPSEEPNIITGKATE